MRGRGKQVKRGEAMTVRKEGKKGYSLVKGRGEEGGKMRGVSIHSR